MDTFDLSRRLAAEALGTGILVATVVGSGIMAETLTKDVALALLCNTLPTGAILVVLITMLGPVSGAHLNPAVTMVFSLQARPAAAGGPSLRGRPDRRRPAGTMTAHVMFALPLIEVSIRLRTGGAQWLAEGVATFGLRRDYPRRHPLPAQRRALACRPLHHGRPTGSLPRPPYAQSGGRDRASRSRRPSRGSGQSTFQSFVLSAELCRRPPGPRC